MHQTSTAMSEEDGLDDLGDIDDSSDEGAFFFRSKVARGQFFRVPYVLQKRIRAHTHTQVFMDNSI